VTRSAAYCCWWQRPAAGHLWCIFLLFHLLWLTAVAERQRWSQEKIARANTDAWGPREASSELPAAILKRLVMLVSDSKYVSPVKGSLSELNPVIRKDFLQFPNEFNYVFSKSPKKCLSSAFLKWISMLKF